MKKGVVLAELVLILVLNFITKDTYPILSNILLLVFSINCSVAILYFSGKDKEFKILWILGALVPFFWAVEQGHVLFGSTVFPMYREDISFATSLLLLPELIIMLIILLFMIKGFRKIYWTKFFLDTFVILLLILGIASGVVFSHLDYSTIHLSVLLILCVDILIDTIIVVTMLLLLTSVNRKKVEKELYVMCISFALFVYADFDQMYNVIVVNYHPPFFSQLLFYVSFFAMVIGVMIAKRPRGIKTEKIEQKIDNLSNTRVVLYVMALPIYLFFRGEITIAHLTIMGAVVIVYQYVNVYIQRAFNAEQKNKEKEVLMKDLEYLVELRTHELKRINTELYVKSTTDDLTGLYNRSNLIDTIEEFIANETPIILLKLNMEKFWLINSYHGHILGDQVLLSISGRLKDIDRKGIVIARTGGSKFAIIIPSTEDYDYIEETDRILDLVKEPVTVDDFSFHLDFSAGIARFPEDAETANELFRDATLAMNHVRNQKNKTNVAQYSKQMIHEVDLANHIEILLRDADFENDFELYYQPKFDILKNELIGMEALIRWNHKIEGFISPGDFIPVAEETGLIVEISDWVFLNAMKQISKWNKLFGTSLVMSMNVSPVSIDRFDFVDNILKLMDLTEVNPKWVELEITEYMAISSESKSKEVFSELRKAGISISIDDFGTGYSSLSYMKEYEIDVIKIARELVMNIVDDQREKLIIQAIVTMAQGMGIKIIAEGVEMSDQMNVLRELGCIHVQGYLTGKPTSRKKFEELYLIKESQKIT